MFVVYNAFIPPLRKWLHACIYMYDDIGYVWLVHTVLHKNCPDGKVHGAHMGPTWDRQDPGGPHVGHVNFVIWVYTCIWR